MTDNEELQQHIESNRMQPIEAYRIVEDDARSRHNDATLKITEAQDEIHRIESRMHDDGKTLRQWKEHLTYQQRRQQAQEQRLLQARASRRMAEDDDSGVYAA
jgi:hypothetical protein